MSERAQGTAQDPSIFSRACSTPPPSRAPARRTARGGSPSRCFRTRGCARISRHSTATSWRVARNSRHSRLHCRSPLRRSRVARYSLTWGPRCCQDVFGLCRSGSTRYRRAQLVKLTQPGSTLHVTTTGPLVARRPLTIVATGTNAPSTLRSITGCGHSRSITSCCRFPARRASAWRRRSERTILRQAGS
jgi:hypothetical protein